MCARFETSLFCFPKYGPWNTMTKPNDCLYVSLCFISLTLLSRGHCPHADACFFCKGEKKSIPRTLTSSALPFPQSKSPEGLIFLGLLLPCYQQLWQACIGPLWHRCKYWLYVSNHSSSSEMSLGWACVLTVVLHCLIVKTGAESPLYINDCGVLPWQNKSRQSFKIERIYSMRTHIHIHDIHTYICDDPNQNFKWSFLLNYSTVLRWILFWKEYIGHWKRQEWRDRKDNDSEES